jgi:hypothetical protein
MQTQIGSRQQSDWQELDPPVLPEQTPELPDEQEEGVYANIPA